MKACNCGKCKGENHNIASMMDKKGNQDCDFISPKGWPDLTCKSGFSYRDVARDQRILGRDNIKNNPDINLSADYPCYPFTTVSQVV